MAADEREQPGDDGAYDEVLLQVSRMSYRILDKGSHERQPSDLRTATTD